MLHILFALILFLPLSARAVIPLETVAEFELPEDAVAWDVQHWMDDSTYGWAALRNDSVFYVTRMSETVQSVAIGESYLDSVTRDGPPDYTQILILGGATPSVIVVANISDHNASQWEDYEYDYFLVLDLESGETSISFRITTFIDPDWLWTDWRYFVKMSAWPPPPMVTQSLRTLYAQHGVYWSPYHTTDDGQFGEYSMVDGHSLLQTHATDYDFFPGPDSRLALVNVETRQGSSSSGFHVDLRRTLSSADSLFSRRLCYGGELDENGDPISCPRSWIFAATNSENERRMVYSNLQFDATDISVVSQLNEDYSPEFAFNVEGISGTLLGRRMPDSTLRIWNLETTFEDTTTSCGAPDVRIVKDVDGIGTIVAYSNYSDSVRVFRPVVGPRELILSYNPTVELLVLRWHSLPGASSYIVYRSQCPDGDFCEQDSYSVADTSIALPLIQGINKEFFRVKAVFN